MPDLSGPVGGRQAAIELLSRPDVRPAFGSLSEDGGLLVWWELRGIRDRDAFRCRYPVAVTWAPREGWWHGVRPRTVHAWVLADGMREVYPTRTGFYIGHSECSGRAFRDQAPGLVVGHRGRLRTARLSAGAVPPQEGAFSVPCPPPTHGSCQLDPDTGIIRRLPGRYGWEGAWDHESSIVWRWTGHISGTWSVDGGATWNQFMDTWDASPLRLGGSTFAVSTSKGVRSSVSGLDGGHFRKGTDYTYTEWRPGDRTGVVRLPRSRDGYRTWQTTPDGTLVGIGRAGGVYISKGIDWDQMTRREAGPCRDVDLVGRLLECPIRRQDRSAEGPEMRASANLGRTWSRAVPLDQVAPPGVTG